MWGRLKFVPFDQNEIAFLAKHRDMLSEEDKRVVVHQFIEGLSFTLVINGWNFYIFKACQRGLFKKRTTYFFDVYNPEKKKTIGPVAIGNSFDAACVFYVEQIAKFFFTVACSLELPEKFSGQMSQDS